MNRGTQSKDGDLRGDALDVLELMVLRHGAAGALQAAHKRVLDTLLAFVAGSGSGGGGGAAAASKPLVKRAVTALGAYALDHTMSHHAHSRC